ncbi:response regulator [Arenimonas caeni]|jgi:CheY-like chemotaxis protein|uniref:Response regulator n=1 Tax=Arenimonas caeni TaxID=2058085 RepID=A0A2P6M6H4_9GAMM|nr:response regulator [Arenimonas caeni]PRH81604.1 response regulator [Arenimonas caeni]
MNPRLLLLEDDPVSAATLSAGLASLPAEVEITGTVAAARERALQGGHALWLFDLQLPDGRGEALLSALRAAGLQTPALALSADDGAQAPGFLRVLPKPIDLASLRRAVAAVLPPDALPPWDEAAGLAAVAGQAGALAQLRRLFLDELPAQQREIRDACAAGQHEQARAVLHRLKASCGFVGALPLLDAVRALHAAPADAMALRRFVACSERLLDAGGR